MLFYISSFCLFDFENVKFIRKRLIQLLNLPKQVAGA